MLDAIDDILDDEACMIEELGDLDGISWSRSAGNGVVRITMVNSSCCRDILE